MIIHLGQSLISRIKVVIIPNVYENYNKLFGIEIFKIIFFKQKWKEKFIR